MTHDEYLEQFRKYLDPATVARLSGLALQARCIVEGYLAGLHRSPYHGFSVEFAQHREYVPGDDIKHIDWKVWGRTDKYYLKQYEEETNLRAYVVLDASESMSYRSGLISKFEYARFVGAALAYLVLKQQDSIGLIVFGQRVQQFLRASNQPTHLKQVLRLLENTQPSSGTDLGVTLHDVAERLERRSLIILLTDFFGEPEQIYGGLQHLRHRRHDVIAFQVLDAAEVDFPFRDTTLFEGLEGLPNVLADPWALRAAYRREFEGFRRELERQCRARQVDYCLLRTDRPLDVALSSYLAARGRRFQRLR
jgi:uncharacterized protein (DUF58 family)